MRKVGLQWAFVLALLSFSPLHATMSAMTDESSGTSPFQISDRTNVCVSVIVDRKLWVLAQRPAEDLDVSGILSAKLKFLAEAQGSLPYLPGPRHEVRFLPNDREGNPFCQDRRTICS